MEQQRNGTAYMALAIAGIALVIAMVAYAGRPKPQVTVTSRPPATLTLSMVVATFTGQGMAAHRWYPTMLVVRQGDTVDLAVANPDTVSHLLEVTGYNIKSKILAPNDSDALRFVADRTGVFAFRCALPYDPVKHHCTPDHEQMLGYLIVTE